LGFHIAQDGQARSSVISPKIVMEVGDELEIFELREKILVEESLDVALESGDICTFKFKEAFRDNFLGEVSSIKNINSVIFENLTLEGRDVEKLAESDRDAFFKNILYPDLEGDGCENGDFIFKRAKIGKEFTLRADDTTKINFQADFKFEFKKTYLISFKGDEFLVETR